MEYDNETEAVKRTPISEVTFEKMPYKEHHVMHNRDKNTRKVQVMKMDTVVSRLQKINDGLLEKSVLGSLLSNYPLNNTKTKQKVFGQIRLVPNNVFVTKVPNCALFVDYSIKTLFLEKIIQTYISSELAYF